MSLLSPLKQTNANPKVNKPEGQTMHHLMPQMCTAITKRRGMKEKPIEKVGAMIKQTKESKETYCSQLIVAKVGDKNQHLVRM